MSERLKGKVALITGGSLGIGRATAELFAQEGAQVAVTDILAEQGKELCDSLRASGGEARYWQLDVTDEEQVKETFAAVEKQYGALSVLVNNAGIAGANKPTHELTQQEWDAVQAVNVKGVFLCTKYAIPQMMKNRSGSIINLSSIYGLVSAPDVPPYHASKGAVRLMSKTDALLYAKEGIRVNSVHPAFIWTPLVEQFLRDQGMSFEEGKRVLGERHPVGHVGEPSDIAYGILYLASDEAKFVTGTELVIDGGYTCR